MRNTATVTCIMLALSTSAHAMDSSMPDALSPESVPPAFQSLQTAPLASAREEVSVVSIGENEAPRARPVIVVRLQDPEPAARGREGSHVSLQADIEYERRRLDRLARFVELALRNSRNHSNISQDWIFEKPVGLSQAVNVFASSDQYGIGLGWPAR